MDENCLHMHRMCASFISPRELERTVLHVRREENGTLLSGSVGKGITKDGEDGGEWEAGGGGKKAEGEVSDEE